jgi:hypothetical protein
MSFFIAISQHTLTNAYHFNSINFSITVILISYHFTPIFQAALFLHSYSFLPFFILNMFFSNNISF